MNLICYLSNGYPTIENSIKIADIYADAGCDIIEIDFPSRNPFLESKYISQRMNAALKHNDNYEDYMKGMVTIKKRLKDTKFILMIYENTLKEIGYERFVSFCRGNNFLDLILVGIEDDNIKTKLMEDGLHVSCYVQFHLDPQEVEHALNSNGFVYLQARPTGNNIHNDDPTLKACISHLKSLGITRPIYCGVGVHTPQDAKIIREADADGIFVGKTILSLHGDKHALAAKIKEFKKECE